MVRWLVEVLFIQTLGSRGGTQNSYRYTVCGVLIALEVIWTVIKLIIRPLENAKYVSRADIAMSCSIIVLLVVLYEAVVSVPASMLLRKDCVA